MPLTEEQAKNIKEQLLKQIENIPEPQKSQLKQQIQSMNPEQLEQFMRQQGIWREGGEGGEEGEEGEEPAQQGEQKPQECIFCSIIKGKTPSYKLDENKKAMAILEINPLTRGHTIVLSKNHDKLPSSAFSIANKISTRLKSKLKAQDVKIENSKILGHEAIQVIPFYKDVKPEKKKADEKELILLQDKLKSKKREKKEKPKQVQALTSLPQAPRRIP
jgi:diadenosine tetraphosphate (Ap4A) HIT family hydrolase